MSVVNKMLRDLESRVHPQPASVNYVPPRRSNAIWVVLALLTSFAIVAASYQVYLAKQDSSSTTPAANDETFELQRGDQYAASSLDDFADVSGLLKSQENEQYLARVAQLAKDTATQSAVDLSVNAAVSHANSFRKQITNSDFTVSPSDGAQTMLSNLRAQAHLASQNENENEVIHLLNKIITIAPNEKRTRKQLASLLFAKNRLTEAEGVLSKGLEYDPTDSNMRLMLSRIHFKTGNNIQAFNLLATYPYQNLASDELVNFRAALAEKIGAYRQAQLDYEILVKRNPKEAKWWLGLAVSQDKQGFSEYAIDSYQKALSLNQLPQNVGSFVTERIQLLARES